MPGRPVGASRVGAFRILTVNADVGNATDGGRAKVRQGAPRAVSAAAWCGAIWHFPGTSSGLRRLLGERIYGLVAEGKRAPSGRETFSALGRGTCPLRGDPHVTLRLATNGACRTGAFDGGALAL